MLTLTSLPSPASCPGRPLNWVQGHNSLWFAGKYRIRAHVFCGNLHVIRLIDCMHNSKSAYHQNDHFKTRISAATDAKQILLQKFHNRPKLDDPAVIARQAAQKAVSDARAVRVAERKAAAVAEVARLAALQAAEAAAQKARETEEALRAAEQAAREIEEARQLASAQMAQETRAVLLDAEKKARALALAAEQKALRDARYAARKARR